MTTERFTVRNPTGFHTRPARLFVDTANERYPNCEVKVIKGERAINGKSVIAMLTLGAKFGDVVTVQAEGDEEEEAARVLGAFFEKVFEE
jgi:phosphocarrier protein HPr